MTGKIYITGRQTREASKITVYKGFGSCKGCGYALDDEEARLGLCKACQALKT